MTYAWKLDEAINLIRKMQPIAHYNGYHLGIAGGVLNHGYSEKDLDIMIMPLNDPDKTRNIEALIKAFEAEVTDCHRMNCVKGAYGDRIVSMDLVVLKGGNRIDLFIVNE